MSKPKFLKDLKEICVGNEMYLKQPLYRISNREIPPEDLVVRYSKRYEVKVELGANFSIPIEFMEFNPDLFEKEKESIGRAITEELYGEIRNELYNLYYMIRQEVTLSPSSPVLEKMEKIIDMVTYDAPQPE